MGDAVVDALALETYLHEHIPISVAMGVTVVEATLGAVTLSAPLAPNINHRDTVFGGSASAVAILAAWALVRVRLEAEEITARLVIQRNAMEYLQPILGEFTATSVVDVDADWEKLVRTFRRKGRGRVSVRVVLSCRGHVVGEFSGVFVAIAHETRGTDAS